jgi:hypothetical protein
MKVPFRRVRESAHIGNVLLVVFSVLTAAILAYPALNAVKECGPRSRGSAKNNIMGLVTALKAYRSEYGHLPHTGNGTFLVESAQARLLKTLQAQDLTDNPRGIAFFEARIATRRQLGWEREKFYSGGISPETGVLLDDWGRPYRIQLAPTGSEVNRSPYSDDHEVHAPVIVWSVGKDGVQGSPGRENTFDGSDDVVSWR